MQRTGPGSARERTRPVACAAPPVQRWPSRPRDVQAPAAQRDARRRRCPGIRRTLPVGVGEPKRRPAHRPTVLSSRRAQPLVVLQLASWSLVVAAAVRVLRQPTQCSHRDDVDKMDNHGRRSSPTRTCPRPAGHSPCVEHWHGTGHDRLLEVVTALDVGSGGLCCCGFEGRELPTLVRCGLDLAICGGGPRVGRCRGGVHSPPAMGQR